MRLSQHQKNTIVFTRSTMPVPATARRPGPGAVRPQAALGPVVGDVVKTAITSGAITAAFGGLLEVLAPHGQRDTRRTLSAMQYGGTVGGAAALGVAVPQAIAVATGVPLGVVVGASLIGAWSVLRVWKRR